MIKILPLGGSAAQPGGNLEYLFNLNVWHNILFKQFEKTNIPEYPLRHFVPLPLWGRITVEVESAELPIQIAKK